MADKTYWLGELVGNKRVGGIKVGGKLYAIGEPFPADKVDKKTMSGLKKAGCVGSVPFKVADSASGDKDMALLQGRVKELMVTAKVDGDRIAELELELEAVGGADIELLKNQVNELDSERKRLTTDNEEKAALIKEQKSEIKALKKEVEK